MNGRGLDLPQKVYTVYLTVNLLNGKRYIGQHKTVEPNDSYLGSGTLLKQDIKRFGRQHFNKKVLFIFNSFDKAGEKELELIKLLKPEYNVSLQGHYSGERGMAASPEARRKTLEKSKITFAKKRKIREKSRFQTYIDNPKICPRCNKIIPFEKRGNAFCSRSCANSRKHTLESKEKLSYTLSKKYNGLYAKCRICGKQVRKPLEQCKVHKAHPSTQLNLEEYKRDSLILNRGQLAAKYGVSRNTITAWNKRYS